MALVVLSTIILMIPNHAAMLYIENIKNIEDMVHKMKMKEISQELGNFVAIFTDDEDLRNSVGEGGMSPEKVRKTSYDKLMQDQLLSKLDINEERVRFLESENESLVNKVQDLEGTLLQKTEELEKATNELKHQKFQNQDFKDRANIGLIDCLEMDNKRLKELNQELKARLDDKQREYQKKLGSYQERFEEYRERANDLESYRVKYEEVKRGKSMAELDELDEEEEKKNEEIIKKMNILKDEIGELKKKNQTIHDQAIKDKEESINLEISINQLESENLQIDLEKKSLQLTVQELQTQLADLKRADQFIANSTTDDKVGEILRLLHVIESESSKKIFAEIQKKLDAINKPAAIAEDEQGLSDNKDMKAQIVELRKAKKELMKQLKDLKEIFLKSCPNPSLEELGQGEGQVENATSLIAEQLLKKVLIHEEQIKKLEREKRDIDQERLLSENSKNGQIELLYAIIKDNYVI